MSRLARTMRANGGYGIVAFELAGSTAGAKVILGAWDTEGRRAAARSLVVDVPFVASYVAVPVVVACASAAALRPSTVWPLIAAIGGWAYVVAGAIDLVEDALLAVLLAEHDAPPAGLARSPRRRRGRSSRSRSPERRCCSPRRSRRSPLSAPRRGA